ncbi:COP1-interactive protein 1-like [Solanum lycopersicum]|uniref:COP1-interactive protein 1-like n=1 Tax=Solanum lycopersicum TaxID=4081 RepID=UPI0037484084
MESPIPKERIEWNAEDKLAIQNNAKAKKILICGIGPEEYNRISSCQDNKAIWETLQTTNKGTTQIVPTGKTVRKLLSVLPDTWESKVEAITEHRDLDALAVDEVLGNLITYELKKNQEKEIGGKRKERNLVLKATASDDFEDENIALITTRFTRMLKRGQTFQKKTPQKSNESTKDQVCHKCGSPDHFIKFCPLWSLEQKKTTSEKGKDIKKDKFVPSNRRMTTEEADISMKKVFAAMGNSSDEEYDDDETENKSLLALEQEDDYDFLALVAVETKEEKETCRSQETILALMAGSDSEEDKEEEDINEKVSLHHIQDNINSYSKRELESLLSTLIDAYNTIDSKKELIMEDYASLRQENKKLEKQNLHLLSENTELSENLELVSKRNEELTKELLVPKTEAENGMRWTRSFILLNSQESYF